VTGPTRHPSAAALDRWLVTGRPGRVDRHVAGCDECAAALEARSELVPEMRAGLAAATAPPDDLGGRTDEAVRERIAADDALAVVLELFLLPLEVAGTIGGPEGPTARRAGPPRGPSPGGGASGEDGAGGDDDDGERSDG